MHFFQVKESRCDFVICCCISLKVANVVEQIGHSEIVDQISLLMYLFEENGSFDGFKLYDWMYIFYPANNLKYLRSTIADERWQIYPSTLADLYIRRQFSDVVFIITYSKGKSNLYANIMLILQIYHKWKYNVMYDCAGYSLFIITNTLIELRS